MIREITPYQLAQRFIGVREIPGKDANPQILAMLKLDDSWPDNDEVPWCSAFVNYICWLLRLSRSKSLRARSWLSAGEAVDINEAWPGYDVAILNRGIGKQPGPEVTDAPGHVGFYAGREKDKIAILGGNQGDSVSVSLYPAERLLGIRRLR